MGDLTKLPPYLEYSQADQLEKPVETSVTGEIPKWISGTLYRNGSGMFKIGKTTVKHLFDGMAVLHKFVIEEGKVMYQHKLLDSDTLKKSLKADRLIASQFASAAAPDPCKNIFARYFSYFLPGPVEADNTAVNIVPHGDVLLAMTETPQVNIIDPETLGKKNSVNISDVVAVHVATAHPLSDRDGTMYNLGTCFNPSKAFNIVKIPPQEKGEGFPINKASIVATIPSRWKFNISYNHSFGMSENYFIILEQTLTVNSLKIPLLKLNGFASIMTNYPKEKSIIHVVRRSDGKDFKFAAEAFFCFHFVNCYEDDGHVIVDMVAFDDGAVVHSAYLDDMIQGKLSKFKAKFRRFVLPVEDTSSQKADSNLLTLKDTTATAVKQRDGSILCTSDYLVGDATNACVMELPRINDYYIGRKYKYAYGTGFLTERNELTKIDVESKKVTQWKPEANDQAGEPVFVPRPGGTEEDDGVILSPVMPMDGDRKAYLVILDAKTFKELGRAVAPHGVKMPISFHGSFVP